MKKSGLMDRILIFIATLLIVFSIGMIILYIKTGGIPDTLVSCVFAVCGGECGVMGWIKTTKDKVRERAEKLEDEARAAEQLHGAGAEGEDAPQSQREAAAEQLHGVRAAVGEDTAAEQDKSEAQEGLEDAG